MRTSVILMLAALTLVANRPAEAVPITFNAVGTFSSPTGGCTSVVANTVTCGGYVLTFSSTPTVLDVPSGSTGVVNFGQVTVTGHSPTLVSGGASFALQIFQTAPAPAGGSPFIYAGTLTTALKNDFSGSFLQFAAPFVQTVTGPTYNVFYQVTEADHGTLGRSDISGLWEAALDINGTVAPVAHAPEPASFLLLGSGIVAVARKVRRKSRV